MTRQPHPHPDDVAASQAIYQIPGLGLTLEHAERHREIDPKRITGEEALAAALVKHPRPLNRVSGLLRCSQCEETKDASAFSVVRKNGQRHSWCKPCKSAIDSERIAKRRALNRGAQA